MAEWSIAAVLKTVEGHTSGGSNPSLSAKHFIKGLCQNRRSLFFDNLLKNIKQSPDFHKPGLCHVRKFL